MSIRLCDIARWPLPPAKSPQEKIFLLTPKSYTWKLMAIQQTWLQECTSRYGFDDVDETLRHLIYFANSEPSANKRLLFKIKRCLHCHVGARMGQHPKVDVDVRIHQFQFQWLIKITEKCEIASVEKCIRIICDFYQSSVKKAFREAKKDGLERELELFGMNRQTDKRLKVAVSEWKSNLDANQSEKEVITKHKIGCDLKELAQDQAACSEEDTLAAIRRCKIGRGSSSYADALGETKEETAARRAKELVVEQSKEAKENRALIRRALGGVMG